MNQKMKLEQLISIAMDLTVVRDEIKLESDSCDYTLFVSRDDDGFIDVIVYNRDNLYEFSGGDIYQDDEFAANLDEHGIDLESEDWHMSSWDMGIIRDAINELVKAVEAVERHEAST